VAIPGKPSARLTHYLTLIAGQRFLRFSIFKETPAAPQAFKVSCVQQEIWDTLCPNGREVQSPLAALRATKGLGGRPDCQYGITAFVSGLVEDRLEMIAVYELGFILNQ
jgi:hypothetical protein